MKAVISAGFGQYRFVEDFDIPTVPPRSVLILVHAVALNPRDGKIADTGAATGSLSGCDFSGIVSAIGDGVTRFKEGDRILAVTFGSDASDKTKGAFGEFALADEDFGCHVPESLTLEQACSIGLSLATAGLALFQAPGLMLSMEHGTKETVLISGGATATGTMATQLLKVVGYDVIVTCSPVSDNVCKAYGASTCFDYHSAACGADIRVHTNNSLRYVLDCVTDATTMKMCYESIGTSGGSYIALEPIAIDVKYTRRDVRAQWLLADAIVGDGVLMSGTYGRPSMPEYRQFGKKLFTSAETWLQEGRIVPHPIDVLKGGLRELPTAVANMKLGKERAKKLVMPVLAATGHS